MAISHPQSGMSWLSIQVSRCLARCSWIGTFLDMEFIVVVIVFGWIVKDHDVVLTQSSVGRPINSGLVDSNNLEDNCYCGGRTSSYCRRYILHNNACHRAITLEELTPTRTSSFPWRKPVGIGCDLRRIEDPRRRQSHKHGCFRIPTTVNFLCWILSASQIPPSSKQLKSYSITFSLLNRFICFGSWNQVLFEEI
jgi:hypothetical protein